MGPMAVARASGGLRWSRNRSVDTWSRAERSVAAGLFLQCDGPRDSVSIRVVALRQPKEGERSERHEPAGEAAYEKILGHGVDAGLRLGLPYCLEFRPPNEAFGCDDDARGGRLTSEAEP